MIHGLYVEAEAILRKWLPRNIYFYYLCGGRGIGKTYGALDLCRKIGTGVFQIDEEEEDSKFLYLRRTGVEAEATASPEACPFKKYNKKEGYDIYADFYGKLGFGSFFMSRETEEPMHIGYCAALSTFSNLRGIDFSDVSLILYDECIPENKNKRPIKDEGYLFLDMYETINRNRIMDGKKEVVVIFLSNPIDLGSVLLSQLELTPIFNNMIFKDQERYTDYNRCLHIEKYVNHPVSREKEKGVLYRFAQSTGYNDRALSGDFVQNDMTLIQKPNLGEYTPFVTLENLCIYKHKTENKWHISQILGKTKYNFRAFEREKFRDVFYWKYKLMVVQRLVTYDNFNTKVVFEAMINYKPLQ